jgi:hypothetical protein
MEKTGVTGATDGTKQRVAISGIALYNVLGRNVQSGWRTKFHHSESSL